MKNRCWGEMAATVYDLSIGAGNNILWKIWSMLVVLEKD